MRNLSRYEREKLDKAFLRSYRREARAAQRNRCYYCTGPISAATATADHVTPKAAFGLDHRNNIVAACEACNLAKAHSPAKQFIAAISGPVVPSGAHGRVLVAWAMRRVNLRLEVMARRLGVPS